MGVVGTATSTLLVLGNACVLTGIGPLIPVLGDAIDAMSMSGIFTFVGLRNDDGRTLLFAESCGSKNASNRFTGKSILSSAISDDGETFFFSSSSGIPAMNNALKSLRSSFVASGFA